MKFYYVFFSERLDTLTQVLWPSNVKCEMNVEEWEKELSKHGMLAEYSYLLEGFVKGFHRGIPAHTLQGLWWFSPPNHKSALDAKENIKCNIKKEVLAGRMCGPFSETEVYSKLGSFRTSPLGAVINGDGSFRPIKNLSFPRFNEHIPSVNSFVDKDNLKTTWDDFKVVAAFFRKLDVDVLIGIFDWWVLTGKSQPTHHNGLTWQSKISMTTFISS